MKCWMQEEQGETAGGVSNDEETDQDNVKDIVVGDGREAPVHCSQKLKSQKVNEGDACEQVRHNTYIH